MKIFNTKAIAATLLVTLLATAAYADQRSGQDRQSPEAKLATAPGLTQTQRDEIIRIEKENREARQALMEKMRTERETLREDGTKKLRAALGDKAYANYVTWKLEQRREHRGDRGSRGDRHERRGNRKGHRPASSDTDEAMDSAPTE